MSRKTRREKVEQSQELLHSFEQYKPLTPLNKNQESALVSLRNNTLSILTGPPGTAKTLLSTFVACELLQRRQIEKIYYVKPVVKVKGEAGLGFLPGDLGEKIEPHIAPLKDSLNVFMSRGKSEYLLSKKIIEFMPIEHLRGRSLDRAFIIADEMQNATTESVMTILTRAGHSTKIALLGDVVQRDLEDRFGKDGLSDAARRLGKLSSVGHVEFQFADVVRSEFVKQVIRAYSDLYERI